MLRLAEGATCGIAAGIVTGVAARIAMRRVADGLPDTMSRTPTLTLEGTVAVLIIATAVGAPLGLIYATTQSALRGPDVIRGACFGTILLGTFGPLFFYGTPLEFGYPGTHLARVSLFALLFLILGVAMALSLPLARRFAQWLPQLARLFIALLALVGAVLLAAGTFALGIEVSRTYGAESLRLLMPWFVLAIIFAIVIRSPTAAAKAIRS